MIQGRLLLADSGYGPLDGDRRFCRRRGAAPVITFIGLGAASTAEIRDDEAYQVAWYPA